MKLWKECESECHHPLSRLTLLRLFNSGLVPNEDAPDIIANTFLAEVTQEQLDAIGLGFLQHRERG
jgi:hypothetical protein